jgi:hypothetical protein
MTYDSEAPTRALAGWHFAHHTERTLSLIGDRVTVFMGVPTYRSPTPWAEDLPTALRGVRQGVTRLRHRPRRPYGVAVYADWTTDAREWAAYRAGWLGERTRGVLAAPRSRPPAISIGRSIGTVRSRAGTPAEKKI